MASRTDDVASSSGGSSGRLSARTGGRLVPPRGQRAGLEADMLKALFADRTPAAAHRGWPRFAVDSESWRAIGEALREGKLDLLGLWGDAGAVHCVLYEPATR